MLFRDRLHSLGHDSYEAYLASPHWKAFKEAYRASKSPRVCAVCGQKPVQLHHHTYDRLGAEHLNDVTPLCRLHHEAVHAILKEKGWSVEKTQKSIRLLRQAPSRPKKSRRSCLSKIFLTVRELAAVRKEKKARRHAKRALTPQSMGQEAREHIDRVNARTGHSPNGPPRHSNHRPARYSEPIIPGNWNDPLEAMRMLARGLRPPR